MPNQTITPATNFNEGFDFDSMPKRRVMHCFQAEGESMNNGDIYTGIIKGAIVQCSELKKTEWESKLPEMIEFICVFKMSNGDNFLKAIRDVNFGLSRITLYSLNPDKLFYPDFDIDVQDIDRVFIVDNRVF